MAIDPRKTFTVNNSSCSTNKAAKGAGEKKSFLDNLTKIGDLEVLNDIGGGDIGKGLRVLSAVSDSIRVGTSVVPGREATDTYNSTLGKVTNTALSAVSEGTEAVLDAVKLGGAVDAVLSFNPGVANRAYEAGSQIWDRVKQGKFDITDIPEVFSDLQNLESLFKGIFPGVKGSSQREYELCGTTPYAMDLIAFAPKFQFMFIIEIKYSSPYNDWNENASQVAFVVKTSTRPKFNVDYEEINMYGFRTRVARRVEYQPMEMSFYDDNKNAAHKFYVSYMRATSPIANWKTNSSQTDEYEENGMNFKRGPSAAMFTKPSPSGLGHSASSGPLFGNAKSILQEIKIHHIFDYGNKMSTYHFYNPRISAFTPSDLTMAESGDGCDFTFEFAYDGLYIDHMIDLSKTTGKLRELTDRGGHALRPINPVYANDNIPGEGEPDADQAEQDAPQSGLLGGIAEGLSGAVEGITDTFGNIVGGVTNIAGDLTNGIDQAVAFTGDQLSNISSGISGAINQNIGAQQRAIGGVGDTISNAFKSSNSMASNAKAVNDVFNDV